MSHCAQKEGYIASVVKHCPKCEEETKFCPRCQTEKELNEFHYISDGKYGCWCKACKCQDPSVENDRRVFKEARKVYELLKLWGAPHKGSPYKHFMG